jgi:hypothetical protein
VPTATNLGDEGASGEQPAQALETSRDSACPTVVDTQPLEPVSESKVHGPATSSEQAANPQGPLLEVALDAPIQPRRVERACPSREVPEEVEEIDREPPLPGGAAPRVA